MLVKYEHYDDLHAEMGIYRDNLLAIIFYRLSLLPISLL